MGAWGDEELTPRGQRRHTRLTERGRTTILDRQLGTSLVIQTHLENAYIDTVDGEVQVTLSPRLLENRIFKLRDLHAILSHEIGHAQLHIDDPENILSERDREFAADAFAASIVGTAAMVRALRHYRRSGLVDTLTPSRSHPTIAERIARLQHDRRSGRVGSSPT